MPKSDFVIEKFLGKGAYGSVQLVRRSIDSKMYAMKDINLTYMKEKDRADQLNEVRILASLLHPNILGFYECFVENGHLFIITDYCGGGDLDNLIEQHRKSKSKIPEEMIWAIILQLVAGLDYLHSQKVLHRDIKAKNILVADKIFKISDFGISKVLHANLAESQVGTPYYLSPEMWKQQKYNEKTDVYSLGCLFYELCMLDHPYAGKNMQELQRNVLKAVYKPIVGYYSNDLRNLISAMLEQNPTKRVSIIQIKDMDCITTRHDMYPAIGSPTLSKTTVNALQISQVKPVFLETIKMQPSLNRIFNGHVGGGNPRSKHYQLAEKENCGKLVKILPQLQYQQREKWEVVAKRVQSAQFGQVQTRQGIIVTRGGMRSANKPGDM